MKVTVAALLGARRMVGWSQKEMVVSESTVADLLKQIPLATNGHNLHDVLVKEDGNTNGKYRAALNQQIIDKEVLATPVKEGDRLVVMDAIRLPSSAC
jgi:sulfur carrier protein ThiS